MEKILSFYSSGKLLLSGEYAVLSGAKALALPTQQGQRMEVSSTEETDLRWNAVDVNGNVWFSDVFSLNDFTPKKSENPVSKRLAKLLKVARNLQPHFLLGTKGVEVVTRLEFDADWGLGSSSTLVNNVAQWAQVDAYVLQEQVFGGSGYDIGCAQTTSPILFQRSGNRPVVERVAFWPDFHRNLFFVYLNQKQDSRLAIDQHYSGASDAQIASISKLTETLLQANHLEDFQQAMRAHEEHIGKLIGHTPVHQRLFPDYEGAIKSLGAWGGDFVLACGSDHSPDYFLEKGYATVLPFEKIISRGS